MKAAVIVIEVLAAITALVAALYWFKASQSKLPSIDGATGKPSGPISMLDIAKDIRDATRRNQIAALWSAAAATLGAIALLLGTVCSDK